MKTNTADNGTMHFSTKAGSQGEFMGVKVLISYHTMVKSIISFFLQVLEPQIPEISTPHRLGKALPDYFMVIM